MPDLDLGPNDYRKQDPRTGRWRVPNDPALARNYLFVLAIALGVIFWKRDEFGSDVAFGVTAMFSFFAGGLFATWLRDRY